MGTKRPRKELQIQIRVESDDLPLGTGVAHGVCVFLRRDL